jgi:hypothetical protein
VLGRHGNDEAFAVDDLVRLEVEAQAADVEAEGFGHVVTHDGDEGEGIAADDAGSGGAVGFTHGEALVKAGEVEVLKKRPRCCANLSARGGDLYVAISQHDITR